MRTRTLQHRVTLRRRTDADTALGQPGEEWAPYLTDVAAQVEPLGSREQFTAGREYPLASHRVTIRYRRDTVLAEDQLIWQGRKLRVVGQPVDVDGAGQWLELMCEEGGRDGR